MKTVYYAILPERCVYDVSLSMAQAITYYCTRASTKEVEYIPLFPLYNATDVARKIITEEFLHKTDRRHDTLVMLDVDHDHPPEIVVRLAAHNLPVVTSLFFRRTPGYETCAFRLDENGAPMALLCPPSTGVYEMHRVGFGAVAIQRWVFEEIGDDWYRVNDAEGRRIGEDFWFSDLCRKKKIKLYVDCGIESPHMSIGFVDRGVHADYQKENNQSKPRYVPAFLPQA